MATGDKADLLSSLANNITDNNNKENTPARHRTYASKIITYCLNLVESAKQIVLGPVDFSGDVAFTKQPKFLGSNLLIASDLPVHVPDAYCDYAFSPLTPLALTTTPQIITGWVEDIVAVGITYNDLLGEFTVNEPGVYKVDIERIYTNTDSNPILIVNVSIDVQGDFGDGNGWVSIFNRTAPISSATAIDEPATLSFTTPTNMPIVSGSKLRVLFSAEDNGGNPNETFLRIAKVTANLMHNLPGA